jgi:hypothetical protein
MRVVALLVAAAGAAVAGTAWASDTAGTRLRVTYWEDAAHPASRVTWTLRCNPPGGTLARPRVACGKIAAGGRKLFAPVPPGTVCTQVYGGPQRARVAGTVAGRRVWAIFTRTDGCQIDRWNRVSPWLLPPGGVTR